MIHKKRMISLLSLGLLVLALLFVPGPVWAVDKDGDGVHKPADCDDGDGTVYPGAAEICDDKDNDCNGIVDDTLTCEQCIDMDKDQDNYYSVAGCGTLVDCNDSDKDIYPGAPELCDEEDNNCDGAVDENCVVKCADYNNDGDDYFAVAGCGPAVDCNDSDKDIYPGAPELCDGVDNQCPGDSGYGFTDEVCSACSDADSDDFFASSGCGSAVDCNDDNDSIYPGATENPDNGIDDNCDGFVDGCNVLEDSDCDGLSDQVENSGFMLSGEFELWNGSNWVTASVWIPGAGSCSAPQCLKPETQDLFVLWRPLENTLVDDISTLFEFASKPVLQGGAERQVWVVRERTGIITTSRLIAPDVSDQKLAVLIESAELGGTAAGLSQPGTIMSEDEGKAWIKTHKIESDIEVNCPENDPCELNGVLEMDREVIKRTWKLRTAIHEVWHVHIALETADLHIADDSKVMSPAVIYTKKTNKPGKYYIGDVFSAAGVNDLRFR